MISFDEFKEVFDSMSGEPEITINFFDNEADYMIIRHNECVTFQRCGSDSRGVYTGSGEYEYPSLEELYHAELVDGICLEKMWDEIEIIIDSDTFVLPGEYDDWKQYYAQQH